MVNAKQLQILAILPELPPILQNLLKTLAPLMGMTNDTNMVQIMQNPAVMSALLQIGSNETQQIIKSEFFQISSHYIKEPSPNDRFFQKVFNLYVIKLSEWWFWQ